MPGRKRLAATEMLSRVADSLYWMSRYLERAEHAARLLDVNLQSMLDYSPDSAGQRWARLMRCLGLDTGVLEAPVSARAVTDLVTFSAETEASIRHFIQVARENARQVRQQISSEMWEHLNSLYLRLRDSNIDSIWSGGPHAFLVGIREDVHLFQGVTDSTLSHGEGWHFIQTGHFLERAAGLTLLLDIYFGESLSLADQTAEINDYLDWVGALKSCTAFEAYCKVYTVDLRPDRITEFLLLNAEFPHSVAFCATAIRASLEAIAAAADIRRTRMNRLGGRLCTALDASMDEILSTGLHRFLSDIRKQCVDIHAAIYEKYISYAIEAVLAS